MKLGSKRNVCLLTMATVSTIAIGGYLTPSLALAEQPSQLEQLYKNEGKNSWYALMDKDLDRAMADAKKVAELAPKYGEEDCAQLNNIDYLYAIQALKDRLAEGYPVASYTSFIEDYRQQYSTDPNFEVKCQYAEREGVDGDGSEVEASVIGKELDPAVMKRVNELAEAKAKAERDKETKKAIEASDRAIRDAQTQSFVNGLTRRLFGF